jgi:hypothetical protein
VQPQLTLRAVSPLILSNHAVRDAAPLQQREASLELKNQPE